MNNIACLKEGAIYNVDFLHLNEATEIDAEGRSTAECKYRVPGKNRPVLILARISPEWYIVCPFTSGKEKFNELPNNTFFKRYLPVGTLVKAGIQSLIEKRSVTRYPRNFVKNLITDVAPIILSLIMKELEHDNLGAPSSHGEVKSNRPNYTGQ